MIGKISINLWASLTSIALLFLVSSCATNKSIDANIVNKSPNEDKYEPSYQAVSALVAMGDMDKAVAAYEKEFAQHPNSPSAQALYANLLLGAGQIGKAREVLVPLAEANPGNADVQYGYSLLAALAGDRVAQVKALDKTLKAEPNHTGALSALGELQLQDKHYNDAESTFDRSLKNDPNNYVAILGKAAVLSRTSRIDEAQVFLDKAVNLQPGFSFAWSDRARVEAERGDSNAAEADMAQAIAIEPDYEYHYLDRGRILARAGKPIEAIADFTKVIEMDQKNILAWAYRAQVYQQQGDWSSSKSDYEAVLAQRPDYFPAFEPLGLAAWKSSDWKVAAKWFEKSYDSNADNEQQLILAALAIYNAGDKPEFKTYSNYLEPKLKREGIFYQVLRFLQDPTQEGPIINQVTQWKKGKEKAQASLGVAIGLLKLGRKQTGVLFLQNVIDSLPALAAERQIASWVIDEYTR